MTDSLQHKYLSASISCSCFITTASQPRLAAGFLGLGCIIVSILTSVISPILKAIEALFWANLPTPIMTLTSRRLTTLHKAVSHASFMAFAVAAGNWGTVTFLPDSDMNARGRRLWTKQDLKKWFGLPLILLMKLQNRFPLTCKRINTNICIYDYTISLSSWYHHMHYKLTGFWISSLIIWRKLAFQLQRDYCLISSYMCMLIYKANKIFSCSPGNKFVVLIIHAENIINAMINIMWLTGQSK